MHKIAIIGGGAAGLMVAATLLERTDLVDAQIHLFEKNSKLGAKVIISGGGRCNVTTGFFKMQELLPKYPRGATFIKPALEQFGPRAIKRWFEAHGVPLKQEEDGRIFPVSDDGKDIVGVFERLFNQGGVHVHCKEGVLDITYDEKKGFRIQTTNQTYDFTTVVLTTGGNAYAHTGSSGDGYAWARSLGHTITPLGPSLNSFLTQEERLHACSGISFTDSLLIQGPIHTRGPVLLTHFGISGPAVFAFSSHIPYEPVTRESPYTVLWKPDASKDSNTWLGIITNYAQKKEIASVFRDHFPKKFVESIFAQYRYDPHIMVGNCTKQIRLALATLFGDGIPLTLIQRRPGDEFVTAGGVSLDEVDQNTGQSRKVTGLFFAGELLDIDGYTGGYNLTSSRATGRLVGKKIGNGI